jgi:hypothetical protein
MTDGLSRAVVLLGRVAEAQAEDWAADGLGFEETVVSDPDETEVDDDLVGFGLGAFHGNTQEIIFVINALDSNRGNSDKYAFTVFIIVYLTCASNSFRALIDRAGFIYAPVLLQTRFELILVVVTINPYKLLNL